MTARTWTEAQIRALGVRTDLVTAGAVLGIGRTKSFELAKRNEFPVTVLRAGHRYVVPVAALLRLLELPLEMSEDRAPTRSNATADEVEKEPRHDHSTLRSA